MVMFIPRVERMHKCRVNKETVSNKTEYNVLQSRSVKKNKANVRFCSCFSRSSFLKQCGVIMRSRLMRSTVPL
jgi:hypothetical protein